MSEVVKTPLKLFYCYSHKDKEFRDALDSHLISLKRQKLIEIWYDGQISPGTDWEREIDKYLRNADIVLLLISADFLSSDYCYGKEMTQALNRHKAGTVRVVPIILRPVDWEDEPFGKLQVLPTEAKPVTRWLHTDDAYEDIAKKLRVMIKNIQAPQGSAQNAIPVASPQALIKKLVNKGIDFYKLGRYKEALEVYEEALHLDPTSANAYRGKGDALHELKQHEEELEAYEEVLRLDPNCASDYSNKGNTLNELERYEEALEACEEALRLDPKHTNACNHNGNALYGLKRYAEALEAYEEALRLEPTFAIAYNNKGNALYGLMQYNEALEAYEEALRLNSTYINTYNNMALTLDMLGRTKEAQQAREKARQLESS